MFSRKRFLQIDSLARSKSGATSSNQRQATAMSAGSNPVACAVINLSLLLKTYFMVGILLYVVICCVIHLVAVVLRYCDVQECYKILFQG